MNIVMQPIGVIRTPFETRDDLRLPPCHPDAPYHDSAVLGTVEIHSEFCDGLKELEVGGYYQLLFHFNQSSGYKLITKSHGQNRENVGVFSTRSPHRPNGIGATVIKVLSLDGCRFSFRGVDMLDKTPLLDIKPHSGDKIFDK